MSDGRKTSFDMAAPSNTILDGAVCCTVETVVFFDPDREGEAKACCRSCPVQALCLEYALSWGENVQGVWGGMTSGERRRERGARAIAKISLHNRTVFSSPLKGKRTYRSRAPRSD